MELTVYYYLPDGTAAKDLLVDIGIKHCKIGLKGKPPLWIDHDWHKPIKTDETEWCIETEKDGRKILPKLVLHGYK